MPVEQDQRRERRKVIRKLLSREVIRSQTRLAERLRAEGLEATQSSVSRDLHELGAVKVRGRYVLPPAGLGRAAGLPRGGEGGDLTETRVFVRSIRPAGRHLIVIRTAVGAAQRVALELDRSEWPEIVGTLAGDDTVFVASRGPADQERLLERLAPPDPGGGSAREARP